MCGFLVNIYLKDIFFILIVIRLPSKDKTCRQLYQCLISQGQQVKVFPKLNCYNNTHPGRDQGEGFEKIDEISDVEKNRKIII